jgi:hypothetical protein
VSRHHILPPVVYTPPPPKPKEAKRRRTVGSVHGTSAASSADETEETGEVATPAPPHAATPQRQTPVEATERRAHSTTGNLSDGTLKALLEVQEKEGEHGVAGAPLQVK